MGMLTTCAGEKSRIIMVMAYEWYQSGDDTAERALNLGRTDLATKDELLRFFERLEAELDACGFFHVVEKRPIMVRKIRNIFQRDGMAEEEVRTLHGILSSLVRRPHVPDGGESSD